MAMIEPQSILAHLPSAVFPEQPWGLQLAATTASSADSGTSSLQAIDVNAARRGIEHRLQQSHTQCCRCSPSVTFRAEIYQP